MITQRNLCDCAASGDVVAVPRRGQSRDLTIPVNHTQYNHFPANAMMLGLQGMNIFPANLIIDRSTHNPSVHPI